MLFLALGLTPRLQSVNIWASISRIFVTTAAVLASLALLAPVLGMGVEWLTPFHDELAKQAAVGRPITGMSRNTASTFLAIAASEIFRWYRYPTLSQLSACLSFGSLFIAVTDYIDGLPVFHATMAPLTLLGALLLAVVTLLATTRRGFICVLRAPSEAGRIARLLLGVSTIFVLLAGWLVARHINAPGIDKPADSGLLVYQTAGVILMMWGLVTIGMMRSERIDTRRRAAEDAMRGAVTVDTLTGLLSQNRMREIRHNASTQAKPLIAALLLIDLDRFRLVNEAFGHGAGDQLLVEVGRRLLSISSGHSVGRTGGDEFSLYCTGVSIEEAVRIGVEVRAILGQPFYVEDSVHYLTASVGIAHTSLVGGIELRQDADVAISVAKSQGGNRAVIFMQSMRDSARQQIEMEQELHEALRSSIELGVAYQPIIRPSDSSLYAIEALARWSHPRLGKIAPSRFIQVAEATGLIIPLGLKFMRLIVDQAATWHSDHPGQVPVININVSPLQLATGNVINDLVRVVEQHGLSASAFCIEVTEGAFTNEHALQTLSEAYRLGFKVSMDDFGVGYSSLSQLSRLPLTSIKLDRSFVSNAVEKSGDALLLSAIVKLAHDFGLLVVAEGVEDLQQLDMVSRYGCDAVQGYIFAKPMTAENFSIWLSALAADDDLL